MCGEAQSGDDESKSEEFESVRWSDEGENTDDKPTVHEAYHLLGMITVEMRCFAVSQPFQ
ncbi:MAG: hypothetical protein O3A00_00150 [Planctomycetota bacterium]|nr:hypothetical protein [Planctomycetota bacterium]